MEIQPFCNVFLKTPRPRTAYLRPGRREHYAGDQPAPNPRGFFNEREFLMRVIVVVVCLFAAACSGQASNSPTSPTSARLGSAQTAARAGTELPFRGSFNTITDVPPPSAHATVEGAATHLGRFTGTLAAEVTSESTSTGTFSFTAANGDQLSGTFVGIEGVFVSPNTARITEVATIENGTGRFAGATGTFTMVRFDTIDFATGQATGTGTLEGQIHLNR